LVGAARDVSYYNPNKGGGSKNPNVDFPSLNASLLAHTAKNHIICFIIMKPRPHGKLYALTGPMNNSLLSK